MANQTIQQYFKKAYQSFGGGLNTLNSPLTIPANQFAQLDNSFVNRLGLLEKSTGYILDSSPFSTSAANSLIRMLVNHKRGSTVDNLVCCAQDDGNTHASYKVDTKYTTGDGVWDYIGYTTGTCTFTNGSNLVTAGAGTAFTTHLKAGDKIKPTATSVWYEISAVTGAGTLTLISNFSEATQANSTFKARIILHKDFLPRAITFNNNLLITNGSETPMTYNNTTLTLITDADTPKAKYIESHKSRVFMAGTSGSPSSIYWSAINDETSWDASSVEPIFPNDNGSITNIKSFADSLIVFKDSGKIYQVAGEFDQSAIGDVTFIRRVDLPDNVGLVIGLTASVGNDNKLYFLTETGVYSIDSQMRVSLESWDIKPTFSGLQLKSTLTSSKTYTYDSKTQWDTGTHSGTRATSAGTLEQFFNQFTISDAYQGNDACSCAVDTSNNLHVAYLSSDQQKVYYKKYAASDDAVTSLTACDIATDAAFTATTSTFQSLSIAVAAGGEVGVIVKVRRGGSAVYYFLRNAAGTFAAAELVYTVGGPPRNNTGISLMYGTDNNPRAAFCQGNGGSGEEVTYASYSAGVWTKNESITATEMDGCSLWVSGTNNIYLAAYRPGTTDIYYWTSTNNGSTWTSDATITTTGATDLSSGHLSITLNSLSDVIIAWSTGAGTTDALKLFRRNITTATTATVDSGTDNYLKGYAYSTPGDFYYTSKTNSEKYTFDYSYNTGTASFVNGSATVTGTGTKWSTFLAAGDKIKRTTHTEATFGTILTVDSDTQVTLTANYTGATSAGVAYYHKRTLSITAPSSATLNNSYRVGDKSFANNGAVFGSVAWGANANEILVKRIAFTGTWTGPESSDSTLSAWGTYSVTNQVNNSCTVVHEVALNTASPATAFTPIVSGSVVSSDATKVFVIPRVSSIVTTFAGFTADAIILNYTGTGIDGKIPTSITYDNEIYFSVCQAGQSANNVCLVHDLGKAWVGPLSYPVTVFCRYKNQLYGGSASSGKVYKLLNGYNAAGSAYTMTAITKEDILGSLEFLKDAYKFYVLYKVQPAGTFTFSYRPDNFMNPSGATWTDTVVDQTVSSNTPGIAEIPYTGSLFRSIQFKVSNSTVDNQVGIIGIVVAYGYTNLR